MRIFTAFLAGLLLAHAAAFGQDVSARALRFLEQEYALAKTPSTYFVFDFGTSTVSLRSRGMVLKEWPAVEVRTWGKTGAVMTYPLLRKTAYRASKRKDITPGKAEGENKAAAKTDDLDILELVKMPVAYTLELPGGIRIKVRMRKKGPARILDGFGRFFSRGFGRSAKTIVRGAMRRPFAEIEIFFTEENAAKNIYWSFFEGQKCILNWPD